MVNVDPAQAQRALENFIRFLHDRREMIVEKWMNSIRRDGRMQTSERLTADELSQHVPSLLDDLAEALGSSPASRGVPSQADERARLHGQHRFGQHFRLEELVREIVALRATLIDEVAAFEDQTADFRDIARQVALRRLHGFFDNMIVDAVRQFTIDQQGKLRKDVAKYRENAQRERGDRDAAQSDLRDARLESEGLREIDSSRVRILRAVAHELRNTINSVQLAAVGLQKDETPQERTESISMFARNIDHMDSLLADLLDYALLLNTPSDLRLESTSLKELCDDLKAIYAPIAEAKGLRLELERDPALTTVISNRTKLVQIASNLLSNALKYTTKGSVRLLLQTLDAERWRLAVEDTGPGIIPGEREKIFGEFYRISETAHIAGTGLGLAVAKRAAELLGGKIQLDSEPRRGSRFEVILPQGAPTAPARPTS
jgi:signal transduction histidine kinase